MNICIVGTGYVGLVSGVCFSEVGHNVTCVDQDDKKIAQLIAGRSPIYEPGIEELLVRNQNNERLRFTTNLEGAMEKADIVIIAVGTPAESDGSANLSFIESVAREIGHHLTSYKLVVTKSTVPVGTGQKIKSWIQEQCGKMAFDVASNPEFLREGSAIYDTMHMERAVLGVESEKAKELLIELHQPFDTRLVITDLATAEMSKYAANAFLATKISFINEVANVCEQLDADVTKVAEVMGLDPRIGSAFLGAGIGYGGSCFPKDTQAFIQMGQSAGYALKIVPEVEKVNFEQRKRLVMKAKQAFGLEGLRGKRIAVLGLAFKPNTDDMRAAPARDIIPMLTSLGADVRAYDPIAMQAAISYLPHITFASSWQEATRDADAVIILTDWNEFKELNLQELKNQLASPIVIDGRNLFEPQLMKSHGFYYDSVGRIKIEIEGESYEGTSYRGSRLHRQKLS
ncbi:UDP-glucose dehydrogenase family protein [Alkalicoccobacillus plakortidis]|uniref:UDP-glucose 6-dehydrogenase n=1 Tax=Alkalicoccobacillus plakortidis TaxID=444060 RepID=A0ABT0XII5_9BACI|nr:UDP-glucose/GDP-mannose dehydrogenase family protein [Alkalicoccobacillus plakortidis]MCM2675722.1 UDP-glucose/GDP-mannose dehydrogenase family protein [Alkalicoccobacillus plakortidis]